jgi:phosphoadenosine phosphosulfate reductase
MTDTQIAEWNLALRDLPPMEITRWALDRARGLAVVSTNFRPYEAVILHLATRIQPDLPVIWVDHGFNRPATYHHAEQLRRLLNLNLRVYVPQVTAAHFTALHGSPPSPGQETELQEFSRIFKLEPFGRAMREWKPAIWLTALRKVQNPYRSGLDIVSPDPQFHTLKVSPVFYLSDADLEDYLLRHGLPNEWDYDDPAKADEKRECGLHLVPASKPPVS